MIIEDQNYDNMFNFSLKNPKPVINQEQLKSSQFISKFINPS